MDVYGQVENTIVKTTVSGGLVLKEVFVKASPARIFSSITRPYHLNKWFTQRAKVDLRIRGQYSNADNDRGIFLEIARNRRLRFTWDNPGHAAGSIVEFVLTPEPKKNVRVTLLHYNFKKEKDLKHYSSSVSGWDWALANLKAYVEGRQVISYEEWLKNVK